MAPFQNTRPSDTGSAVPALERDRLLHEHTMRPDDTLRRHEGQFDDEEHDDRIAPAWWMVPAFLGGLAFWAWIVTLLIGGEG